MPNFVASCTSSRRCAIAAADQHLVVAGAVDVRGVDERDAEVQGTVNGRDRLVPVGGAVPLAHPHAAQALCGHGELAEFGGAHVLYLLLVQSSVGWRRGFGQAARVVADLRVEQLQALPLAGEGPAHLLAVPLQQLDAFRLAGARPDQLGVPLHVPHRHPGRAQLGQQRQPVQVAVAEPAAAVPAPLDGPEQADPLVPAQGVLGKTALGGGLADAPGRHVFEPMS